MLRTILRTMATPFFTALGLELGGPLIGSLPAFLMSGRPLKTALDLARDFKIWAMAMAIGGSFTMLRALESTLAHHQPHGLIKQCLTVAGAFAGAQAGYWLVASLSKNP